MDYLAEFAHVPISVLLGMRLVERTAEECNVALTPSPQHVQSEGFVQGGVLAALADAAAVYLLLPELPPERTVTSIEFKLNFLKPALVGAGDLEARARPVQRGRMIALCEVDVSQADRLVAKGLFTYVYRDRRPVREG